MGILDAVTGALGSVVEGVFSSGQARRQMDFQQRNIDHAVEKRVKDLKAAGINPMLAASMGLGGGVSGSGAMAQTPHLTENVRQAAAIRSVVELNSAQAAKADAEAAKARGDTLEPGVASEVARAAAGLSTASANRATQEIETLKAGLGKIEAEIANLRAEARRTGLDADLRARVINLEAELKRLEVAGKKALMPELRARGAAGAAIERGIKTVDDPSLRSKAASWLADKALELRERIEEFKKERPKGRGASGSFGGIPRGKR